MFQNDLTKLEWWLTLTVSYFHPVSPLIAAAWLSHFSVCPNQLFSQLLTAWIPKSHFKVYRILYKSLYSRLSITRTSNIHSKWFQLCIIPFILILSAEIWLQRPKLSSAYRVYCIWKTMWSFKFVFFPEVPNGKYPY